MKLLLSSRVKNITLIVGGLAFFASCNKPIPTITPAFYHWQTNLNLSEQEVNYTEALKVKKLYAKFFDIDWDFNRGEAIPLAQIRINPKGMEGLHLIPTVFITNRTLIQLPASDIDSLASRIYHRILKLGAQLPSSEIIEIQIDCDWTQKTKASYFKLLSAIKQFLPERVILSATIRLHQVKFAKRTGVPPVDRGMLMFYNMGELEKWESQNSILDLSIAKQYTNNFKAYPLPLDVALPIFSWGVLYRNGRMIKLMNNLSVEMLSDRDRFKVLEKAHRYQVVKSTYLDGYYLYEEDLIRIESIPVSLLKESSLLLKNVLKKNDISLSFYHLDTATIKNYPYEQLDSIYQLFGEVAP